MPPIKMYAHCAPSPTIAFVVAVAAAVVGVRTQFAHIMTSKIVNIEFLQMIFHSASVPLPATSIWVWATGLNSSSPSAAAFKIK